MNHDYDDIISRIAEPPIWWDEHAVPRYAPFEPGLQADIYADEVVLIEVRCQSCGHVFHVCLSHSMLGESYGPLAACIPDRAIHYGDPPNIGCCPSGPTMNSEPRRVIEYWSRHKRGTEANDSLPGLRVVKDVRAYMEWTRDPALEVDITPDWVEESA